MEKVAKGSPSCRSPVPDRYQTSLFGSSGDPGGGQPPGPPPGTPLAARVRPRTLADIAGQEHLTGPDGPLGKAIAQGSLPSVILWGPPGTGKTTLAGLLAEAIGARLVPLSAVSSGVADLRRAIDEARRLRHQGQRTVLFIDEIHRFNKAQQDAILPAVEDGTVILIGATTENPSFEVNHALLSRTRVLPLRPLDPPALVRLMERALAIDELLAAAGVRVPAVVLDQIAESSRGDARYALTTLELAIQGATPGSTITQADVTRALSTRPQGYDPAGDARYDTISAFIKSLRGSDPDAAVYYLARMLDAGEDPLFIVRRLVVFAAEDVGLADPHALVLATACQQAVHFVGMPEGYLPLAETVLYLALAPKDNRALVAYHAALEEVRRGAEDAVPLHLRNAPTSLMRELGYGAGYRYSHDDPGPQQYLPDRLAGRTFFPRQGDERA